MILGDDHLIVPPIVCWSDCIYWTKYLPIWIESHAQESWENRGEMPRKCGSVPFPAIDTFIFRQCSATAVEQPPCHVFSLGSTPRDEVRCEVRTDCLPLARSKMHHHH